MPSPTHVTFCKAKVACQLFLWRLLSPLISSWALKRSVGHAQPLSCPDWGGYPGLGRGGRKVGQRETWLQDRGAPLCPYRKHGPPPSLRRRCPHLGVRPGVPATQAGLCWRRSGRPEGWATAACGLSPTKCKHPDTTRSATSFEVCAVLPPGSWLCPLHSWWLVTGTWDTGECAGLGTGCPATCLCPSRASRAQTGPAAPALEPCCGLAGLSICHVLLVPLALLAAVRQGRLPGHVREQSPCSRG